MTVPMTAVIVSAFAVVAFASAAAVQQLSGPLPEEPGAANSTGPPGPGTAAGRTASSTDDNDDDDDDGGGGGGGGGNRTSTVSGSPAESDTRSRSIRIPFVQFGQDEQDAGYNDEQHAEYVYNSVGALIPNWNRYNTNHRQLTKYMPTPIETDITVDEDGSTGYGSMFDIAGGGGGVRYDMGNYKNPGGIMGYDSGSHKSPGNGWGVGGDGGGGILGWFNEPIPHTSHPLPIIAEIRHPSSSGSSSHKLSIDINKIGMLAMIKITILKLKALGFIKAMVMMVLKLKLLIIVVLIKFLMIAKFTKLTLLVPALISLFTMPMLFSRLARLNTLLSQPVTGYGDGSEDITPISGVINPGTITDVIPDESGMRTSRLNPFDTLIPGMTILGQVIGSEKCLERVSCRMAGAKKPNSALIWLSWIASPLSTYIPNKKLKTFVSTFTEVTNYRLDSLDNKLLPKDWTKWCNDHYGCSDMAHKSL